MLLKAEFRGREVELDKPFRTPGESKKFAVYVKDGDKVRIIRFGDPDMEIRRDDPEARTAFRARHKCDTATDKTTARYWSCRMWDNESVNELLKFNDEQRIVYGWASVIKENGEVVVDTQGDVIEPEELEKATAEFMLNVRRGQAMHKGGQIGTVIHSFPLTEQIADSLDILSDKEGWIVGVKIDDDHIWEDVKSGKLRAFSIGGNGMREEI